MRHFTLLFRFALITATFSLLQSQDPGGEMAAPNSEEESTLRSTVVESDPSPSAAPAAPRPSSEQREMAPRPPIETATPQNSRALLKVEVPTVVATKTPQLDPPSSYTSSVSELRQFQRFGVPDALRRSPGVSFTQNGGEGTLSALRIRGMESDQNLILLNGRRLPPGLAGLYQLEYLDVSTLESVQILRGPASSLYGSEAMGGVIDLRTTDARFVETNGLSFYSEGGSFETLRSGGVLTFRENRFGGSIEASGITTSGDRPKSDFENRTLRTNVAFDLIDDAWIDLLGYLQSSDLQVPGDSRSPGFPSNELNFNDSFLISPRLTIEKEDWDFSLFHSYNQNRLKALNAPFFSDSLLSQTGRETEAQVNLRFWEDIIFTLGMANYHYTFERSPIGSSFTPYREQQYEYTSVFGQADLTLPGQLRLIGSARHDRYDIFDDATTYSLSAEKEIGPVGTRIFGKFATGYRVPSGQDILFTINNINDFEPEESRGWEVGIRQSYSENRGFLSATWFENSYFNSPSINPTTFVNQSVDADTKGIELEATWKWQDHIDIYANYTHLDTLVTGGGGFIAGLPGDRLPLRPEDTLNVGLVFSGDRWDLGAEVGLVANRRDAGKPIYLLDDYATTRLFGNYTLSESAVLYGRVENLFDERYQYTRGYEASGFGIFGGLRMTFGK